MDNSAEFSRMLASRYQSNAANNNLVRNDPSQQAAAVAIKSGFAAATAPSASRASGVENTSSTGSTNNPVQRPMAAQSNNSMINFINNTNNSSIGMNPSTGASSGYSNNNMNNNNGSEASTTLSNYNSTLTSSSGSVPMPPPGGHQFFQPPNQQPTMQNTVGLIDPQTRLLLETILRLDDQMRGIVTNSSSSNNDTSLSSTSSDQQQQQQLQQQQQQLLASSQETTTESTTNSTSGTTDPKSSGDNNVANASGTANLQMMFQESSSNSSSSEEETMQVPCRARGQPPEHNYLTAYFTIKKNEKHGRELVCSFPGCRDGGVKFCYCAYCRTPVARRNFRLRHHHANAKLPVKSKNKATKKKAKSLSKHQSKDNVASAVLPTRDRTNVGTNSNNAAAAASMAQAGVMAAAAAAAGAGGNANAVTNLLLESFAQALRQGQIGGGSPTVGEESMANAKEEQGGRGSIGIGQQQHAIANAPTAMEEISRLGDSSASTSTSDGSAVRIPCRARGMPLDHTIESAYFTISKNVKHGDELICSHQECAASGIKFCWCSFCKLPVAKRNFRIRHHHCDLVKPPNMIAGKSVGNGDADKSKKRKAKQQDVPSTSEDSDLTTQSPGADDQEPARVNDDGNNTATSSTGTKKKRKKAWSKLLDKFPTGGNDENKKDWLAKVLLVSDKKTRRGQLRPDIQPHEETKDMAAIYLEKSKKPRKRHRKASV